MSLKHGYTDPIADVPADAVAGKVLPSHWNAEHTFPGAGAGEVVFVDASGHAATDAGLTFDSGTQILTVLGQAATSNLKITGISADFTFLEVDTGTVQLGGSTLLFNVSTGVLGPGFGSPNTNDLGEPGAEWRTGYFGTGKSASATIGSGADGTVRSTVAAPGIGGNVYTIEVVVAGGINEALSAAIIGHDITVTLATDGSGDPDPGQNTASLVAAAVTDLTGINAVATGTGDDPLTGAEGPTTFTGGAGAISAPTGDIDGGAYFVGSVPGASGTVSGADLVAQSLSFVNGIYMGLV